MNFLSDGYLIDEKKVGKEEKVVNLRFVEVTGPVIERKRLTPINPKPGTYTLVVRPSRGEPAFIKEYMFKGAELELVDHDLKWKTDFETPDKLKEYELEFALTVKNSGDLPIYISRLLWRN